MNVLPGEISFMKYRRVAREGMGEVSLDGRMLGVLLELDGSRTVAEVAARLSLSPGAARSVISRLLKLDLIEPVEEAVSVLDGDFFDYLRAQLSAAIGPLAEILIEEAAEDLGHSLTRFPGYGAAELVDLLSREIRREDKRNTFKRNMVEKIKEKGY